MSVQTIVHNSRQKIRKEAIDNTISNSKKYLLKRDYKIGSNYCDKDQFHNSIVLKMMRITTCDLYNSINNVIENGF